MKTYQTIDIRNVVLMGSPSSGKTTLAENMMFEGKVIDRRGTIESENTTSDYTDTEHIYKRSVHSTPLYTEFMDHKFNIIDTPGSDDFIGGMISAFKIADSAIMVINASQGVEVGTEIFNRYAKEYNKPFIVAVNQLDSEKANWEETAESIKKSFGGKVVFAQFPVNPGKGFNSFIDVVKMKMYTFTDNNGTRESAEIPAEYKEKSDQLRSEIIEMAAENDEDLMNKYFENGTLSQEDMLYGLMLGFKASSMIPVMCISGIKDVGVKRLMEFAINVAPSPKHEKEVLKNGDLVDCTVDAPTAIFVYKLSMEQHLGEVAYFKVMQGLIHEGDDLINPENGDKERITSIYAVAGKNRVKVTELAAGDIGCTVKLKSVKANQTLCTPNKEVIFKPIIFPSPKYRTAIKPKDNNDEEKLGAALNKISSQDPTIVVRYAKELKQTILNAQGEMQVNILKWELQNVYKIDVELYEPRISYRETITKIAAASYRHKKQSGGAGQFGEVHMIIEPFIEGAEQKKKFKINGKEISLNIRAKDEYDMPWGGKLNYYNCIVGGAIDARFMPAILKGIMEKMEEGPLTGSYARDINVYIYDGKMHPVDSNEISFKLAAIHAFKEAFKNAGPKIMEPIYNVEVMVPNVYMGDVMSDLQNRRAIVEGMSSVKGFEVLKVRVPLKELYKYSTALSSLTSGSANFTMEFADYSQVPGDVQTKLLKEYETEENE
ncbi:MAG: elongation factor G [Bacteroidales bacterium]